MHQNMITELTQHKITAKIKLRKNLLSLSKNQRLFYEAYGKEGTPAQIEEYIKWLRSQWSDLYT